MRENESPKLICLIWKLSGRIEIFSTLSNVYKKYDKFDLGISIHTLYKKDLTNGFENDNVILCRVELNPGL